MMNTKESPTNTYLASLAQMVRTGHEAASRALAGEAMDPAVVLPTLSAAVLLATHSDYASQDDVVALTRALAGASTKPALDALLSPSAIANLPGLAPIMELHEKIDVLQGAVDLGALLAYVGLDLATAIRAHLDALDIDVLAHPSAHEDLGPAAQLMRNVAAFDADHPLSELLDGIVINEVMPLFAMDAEEAVALVSGGIGAAEAPTSWDRWVRTFLRFFQGNAEAMGKLLALPTPATNVAYAAGLDAIDEKRFTLDETADAEVNVVFRGAEVILEWQGVDEVPVGVDVSATTVLDAGVATTNDQGEACRRWVLDVAPGGAATTITLRFGSGRTWSVALPGSDEA